MREMDMRYVAWVIAAGLVGALFYVTARVGGVGFAAGVAGGRYRIRFSGSQSRL